MLNNELTYANKKLRGWRYIVGLLTFARSARSVRSQASRSDVDYALDRGFWLAGIAGVLMSVVFNYSVTRVFTWR